MLQNLSNPITPVSFCTQAAAAQFSEKKLRNLLRLRSYSFLSTFDNFKANTNQFANTKFLKYRENQRYYPAYVVMYFK